MSNGTSAASSNPPATKGTWPTLPSFAPPRDLTLGGRAPKKVFTPNLVVKRNKNLNVKTSKDTTIKRGGGRGGRGGGRGGGFGTRGGKTSTLIQTKGVFSEGAGDFNVIRKSSSHGRYGGSGGGGNEDGGSSLQRPVLNKDDFKKLDIKADEKKLFEITGDTDEEDCFDYHKTDALEDDLPIRLSEASALATAKKLQKLHVQLNDIAQEELLNATIEQTGHAALPRYPRNINSFLDSSTAQMFMLQLPDILPCENDTDSKDFISKKEQRVLPSEVDMPITGSSGTTRLNLKPDYNWRAMQEGQIGKIIRYKSGKTKLQLGQTLFDLDIAMEPGFMQNVISVRTNDEYEHNTGAMINLGPLHAKITATPLWEDCMVHLEKEEETDGV